MDLHLSISNGFVSSKLYDKRDDFDFDIVNFPILDGDISRSASYGVDISQLIRFARLTSMHLKKLLVNFSIRGIGIINVEKPFLNFIADTMNLFQNSRSD